MTPDKALSLASDIECAIATLRAIADDLRTAYPDGDYCDDEPEAVTEPAVTLEQVRSVLTEKSRSGLTAQVKALLTKHGANKLSDIDPSDYAELLSEAEGLS
jgi:hypothetical protein